MPEPNANTFIYKSQYAQYYENIRGGSPRSIRLIRVEGDQLVGELLGRQYTVDAADYAEIVRKGY
jgi:hypothetical protein